MTDDVLYGTQTSLAITNFPISGRPLDLRVIHALAEVKIACARVNARHGVIDDALAAAISESAALITGGHHDDQFPVDTFQTGSGTSSNMNVNEVVASLATERFGAAVHPNDHVNASQSSNDVFPTAVHVAVAREVLHHLVPSVAVLAHTFERRAADFEDAVKPGRTHLMDAVPVTLGQEFAGYAAQLRRAIERIEDAAPRLCEVPLGGTAVGTGLNTPAGFRAEAVRELAGVTGLPLTAARDAFEAQSVRDGLVETSAALRGLAVSLTKICNDLRWMGSGPQTGLAEIRLPELQAGSSIMPGKVNPVIPEAVLQVCSAVIGFDATVAWAGASGSFELTVQMPVMADALLQAASLLGRATDVLAERCVEGITANTDHLAEQAAASPAVVTALNAQIGYERGARIVKQANAESIPIHVLVQRLVEAGELPHDALAAMDPVRLARPHDQVVDRPARHPGVRTGGALDQTEA
jgi:fumarate hydratase class II